jgi:hypothetical protein
VEKLASLSSALRRLQSTGETAEAFKRWLLVTRGSSGQSQTDARRRRVLEIVQRMSNLPKARRALMYRAVQRWRAAARPVGVMGAHKLATIDEGLVAVQSQVVKALEARLAKHAEKEAAAKTARGFKRLEAFFEQRQGTDICLLRDHFTHWASSVKLPYQRISKYLQEIDISKAEKVSLLHTKVPRESWSQRSRH